MLPSLMYKEGPISRWTFATSSPGMGWIVSNHMFFELLLGLQKLTEPGVQCGAFGLNNTGSESSGTKQRCSINLIHTSLIPSPPIYQGNSTSFKQFNLPKSNEKVRRRFLGVGLEVNVKKPLSSNWTHICFSLKVCFCDTGQAAVHLLGDGDFSTSKEGFQWVPKVEISLSKH